MNTSHLDWARSLTADLRRLPGPLGSFSRVDAVATRRGLESARRGESWSLARDLTAADSLRRDDRPAYELEVFFSAEPTGVLTDPAMGTATDHVRLDCHGIDNTHLDGLNHTSVDRTWYGGIAVDDPTAPSIGHFAHSGIVTRGIHLDIPALRDTDWVSVDEPVTGDELDAALRATRSVLEPGDAVLVDMGRDRYQRSGGGVHGKTRPGIGASGARWLAEQPIGALAWDFLDAKHPDEPPGSVHVLNWAIGLALVDNCDFSRARAALTDAGHRCLFTVAPLSMPGATGSAVTPLAIT